MSREMTAKGDERINCEVFCKKISESKDSLLTCCLLILIINKVTTRNEDMDIFYFMSANMFRTCYVIRSDIVAHCKRYKSSKIK